MLATTAAMIEQFNKNNILLLEKMGYTVHVAGNFQKGNPISDERLEAFKCWLEERNMKWFDIPASRQPYDLKNNGRSLKMVIDLIHQYHYAFIHCHTPLGSVIGRIAAHKTGTKIIYTAHGFHFYNGAPLKNWLLYYPVEKLLSRWTDVLVTINREDFERAKKKFHAGRTVYIPGVGVDTEKFSPRQSGREKIKTELSVQPDKLLLLSVGELNGNKNHETVIRAITGLSIIYVIVGKGELADHMKQVAADSGVDLRLMGFRNDVADFYNAADIFILPSKREGLNVSLMEAMASGLPCLAGRIRGNVDLIEDQNCLFDPASIEETRKAVEGMIAGDKEKSGRNNLKIIKSFDVRSVEKLVTEVYLDI